MQHPAESKANAAIAWALVLSESAVEKRTNAIFSKLSLADEPQVHRWVAASERGQAQHGFRSIRVDLTHASSACLP